MHIAFPTAYAMRSPVGDQTALRSPSDNVPGTATTLWLKPPKAEAIRMLTVSPDDLTNNNCFPSGDHSGAPALLSPRVNWRDFPPAVGTTQTCVTFFHSLSFSIFVSPTV